nr:integrase, catalytic region, zinc finger, CCHC-type, peptidase aspartic, catalytic [Tanacetum cinerariifolium]
MSRDVLTVGSTMRIPLLYRGEYSQWVERFMNYLEEQTDGESMINSIKNGLPNDIYSLIDSNKTAKDLWDALARHMLGSEYGKQDRKAAVLYEYKTFKATEGELLLNTDIRYLQVINDLKKCGYFKDNCELNFKKEIGFENPSYFEKAKDLRPTLYYEKVIGLGYTPMFLTHSDEALEIEKFKRSRENKIEFSYDYGNLNASYVNEKINFEDDYFQEIINPDFEKIDSPFQQTSSLKPYVSNVILEKIIIDLEDEVVNLLEKEKVNMETIESLKSKSFESSEKVCSESENQSENDCLVVENECDKDENPKVIAHGIFKLNVPQCVSPISMSMSSCDSKNVEIKLKRKRRKRKSSKQNVKQVDNDVLRANNDFVHFSDLDTFSSVRRPRHIDVIWKKKGMNDLLYDNNFFIFDDVNVRISPVCKMPFRKKPRDSMHHMTGNRALLTNFVEKFLRTVCFGNNDFAVIAGYGDVVIGFMTIKKIYYVEGLGHNLLSVGQFCDKGLEVAFQKSTCFVRNEYGVDLLTGDRSSNLYTITLNEVASNSSSCLLAKASSSQSWLWH